MVQKIVDELSQFGERINVKVGNLFDDFVQVRKYSYKSRIGSFSILLTLEHIEHIIKSMTIKNIKSHYFKQLVDKVHDDGNEISN